MIEVNQKVKVKENLYDELMKLGIGRTNSKLIHDEFSNTIQHVYHIWKDDDVENQYWATIEMCVEIPLQCLEEIN